MSDEASAPGSAEPANGERRTADSPSPMKPRVYLILSSLLTGPTHGYEILKEIERRSAGGVRLDPGTLYRYIGRLLDEGLIQETDERPDVEDDDPRRRYYRLTDAGHEAVESEARRMASLVEEARERRLIEPTGARS